MIDRVGELAQLDLTESQRRQAKEDMEGMLAYVDRLKELDTHNVEPMTRVHSIENVMRDDVVTGIDMSELLLAGAPARRGYFFAVPNTIDEE